jgi:multidrug efflux pump
MHSIIDAAMNRTRTVMTFVVMTVVAGMYAYINIPKEAYPDIQFPFVMVSLPFPGISPEDAERLLVKPMEMRLRTIEGLKQMQSYGSQNHGGIFLEFDVNMSMDTVLQKVREEVDIARAEIPQDAEEPIVIEMNASERPIIIATIYGDLPERTLYKMAREAKDNLEALPRIMEANLMGSREELLEVILDPAKLEAYSISQRELLNAVSMNNRVIPAGEMDSGAGSFSVKVPGLFESAADVYNLALKAHGDGVIVLSDVAEIRRTFKDRQSFASMNTQRAYGIAVSKRAGENIIEATEDVRRVMEEMKKQWPDTVNLGYQWDSAEVIADELKALQSSVMTAIILVMIIVVGALGVRSGLLVGFAIPTSFLLGFLMLYSLGFTVNTMVMFGLVLAVGILVDGAIVVVEYADRKMAEGLDKKDAFALAGKRMFWPITSSTLTTLAAFVPLLFWPGVTGKFMSYLPFTLIFVLVASLVVALIYLPVLGSLFGKADVRDNKNIAALASASHNDVTKLKGFSGVYARFVDRSIQTPGRYIFLALLLIMIVIRLFGVSISTGRTQMEFYVSGDPQQAIVDVSAKGNYSALEKFNLVREVEEIVIGVPGVATTFANTGGGGMAMRMGPDNSPDSIGNMFVELDDYRTRPHGQIVIEEIRKRVSVLAGVTVKVSEMENGPPSGKAVQLELRSHFPELLKPAITRIREHLEATMPALIEIEDNRPQPGIEYQIIVDRERAGRFGADIATIGSYVQLLTNGQLIGKYRPDDAIDEVDIRVRFPLDARNLDQLDQLRIQTARGHVPITNFVKIVPRQAVSRVQRTDSKRMMFVSANVKLGSNTAQEVAKVKKWIMEEADLDPRIDYKFRGADEDAAETVTFFPLAGLASLVLMAIILVTQFNSFYHAVLILSSVVLSTAGVMLGLIITGQMFSLIMTGVGILALAGIVVNNNIVLIDTFQRFIKDDYDIHHAIVQTATQRLRPILLTTGTTIFGLMPMAIGMSVDFGGRDINFGNPSTMQWTQLSTTVVFGLAFSTTLTLFLTPCLLNTPTRLREFWQKLPGRITRLKRRVRGKKGSSAGQAAE